MRVVLGIPLAIPHNSSRLAARQLCEHFYDAFARLFWVSFTYKSEQLLSYSNPISPASAKHRLLAASRPAPPTFYLGTAHCLTKICD